MSNCSVKLKIHEHIEVLGSTFILNRYIYVCVYMYVCMYVYMFILMYVYILSIYFIFRTTRISNDQRDNLLNY